MVNVIKNMKSEPKNLKEFRLRNDVKQALRNKTHGMFKKYVNECDECSDELRNILKEKQGFICCYCMCSIEIGKTKIEHYKSRKENPNLEVDYKNLYLACDGEKINCTENQDDNRDIHEDCRCKHYKENENKRIVKHCDTCKGKRKLEYIDLKVIESQIKYQSDGTIYSDNEDINRELNYVLNLNIEILKKSRLRAKKSLWRSLPKDGTWKDKMINKQIEKYQNQKKKAPYLGVLLYFLAKELTKKGKIT